MLSGQVSRHRGLLGSVRPSLVELRDPRQSRAQKLDDPALRKRKNAYLRWREPPDSYYRSEGTGAEGGQCARTKNACKVQCLRHPRSYPRQGRGYRCPAPGVGDPYRDRHHPGSRGRRLHRDISPVSRHDHSDIGGEPARRSAGAEDCRAAATRSWSLTGASNAVAAGKRAARGDLFALDTVLHREGGRVLLRIDHGTGRLGSPSPPEPI